MSIVTAKRIIKKIEITSDALKIKYSSDKFIVGELDKLNQQLSKLDEYLSNLDQLKPNYNTDEIDSFIKAIMLHIDLLKEKLDKKDFAELQKRFKLLKTIFKFHPTKYSTFAFIFEWFYEWLYFI